MHTGVGEQSRLRDDGLGDASPQWAVQGATPVAGRSWSNAAGPGDDEESPFICVHVPRDDPQGLQRIGESWGATCATASQAAYLEAPLAVVPGERHARLPAPLGVPADAPVAAAVWLGARHAVAAAWPSRSRAQHF